MKAIPAYENANAYLMNCSDVDLKALRLKTAAQFRESYNSFFQQKAKLVNRTIMRAYDDILIKIALLKTEKGKANRINAFVNKSIVLPGLLPENVALLKSLPERFRQSQQVEKILIQCEIFSESANNINNSCDLEIVLNSVKSYEDCFAFFSKCSESDLKTAGKKAPDKSKWNKNKIHFLNNAILRAWKFTLEKARTLGNSEALLNYIYNFYNKSINLSGLLPENIKFLKQLMEDFEAEIK